MPVFLLTVTVFQVALRFVPVLGADGFLGAKVARQPAVALVEVGFAREETLRVAIGAGLRSQAAHPPRPAQLADQLHRRDGAGGRVLQAELKGGVEVRVLRLELEVGELAPLFPALDLDLPTERDVVVGVSAACVPVAGGSRRQALERGLADRFQKAEASGVLPGGRWERRHQPLLNQSAEREASVRFACRPERDGDSARPRPAQDAQRVETLPDALGKSGEASCERIVESTVPCRATGLRVVERADSLAGERLVQLGQALCAGAPRRQLDGERNAVEALAQSLKRLVIARCLALGTRVPNSGLEQNESVGSGQRVEWGDRLAGKPERLPRRHQANKRSCSLQQGFE